MKLLHAYLAGNNPDLLFELEQENRVTAYLQEKVQSVRQAWEELLTKGTPAIVIEELCLHELTKDLRPSRYNYLINVLEEEFLQEFALFKKTGTLTYEIINMLERCQPVFDELGVSELNEDDRFLRYAIIGTVQQYLEHRQIV